MSTQTKVKTQGIRIEKSGGPEVLQYTTFEINEPEANQALVKVHAAGVNFIDTYHRSGKYPFALPGTPGLEGSGVVEKVGANVKNVKAGDHVAWSSTPGSYADHILVEGDRLIRVPDKMSFEQAAAFPLQGMTAHYLLHEFYKVKKGDNVLVHAAAGGMGLLLTQWAKNMGARVIGTVSTEEKAKAAKAAGADDVILYSTQDFVEETKKLTNGKGADYIVDGVGKTTFTKNLDAVKTCGWITLYGSASGAAEPLAPNSLQARAITVSGGSLFNYIVTREDLEMRANAVIKGIQEGWLKLNVDHTFTLNEAKKAHEMLEGRHTTGKIILKVRE
ncbi:MAG TPA: quinone oxidoreductase [Planktothrix sp.]|jgi:NADPH2:quinone reductase